MISFYEDRVRINRFLKAKTVKDHTNNLLDCLGMRSVFVPGVSVVEECVALKMNRGKKMRDFVGMNG